MKNGASLRGSVLIGVIGSCYVFNVVVMNGHGALCSDREVSTL